MCLKSPFGLLIEILLYSAAFTTFAVIGMYLSFHYLYTSLPCNNLLFIVTFIMSICYTAMFVINICYIFKLDHNQVYNLTMYKHPTYIANLIIICCMSIFCYIYYTMDDSCMTRYKNNYKEYHNFLYSSVIVFYVNSGILLIFGVLRYTLYKCERQPEQEVIYFHAGNYITV